MSRRSWASSQKLLLATVPVVAAAAVVVVAGCSAIGDTAAAPEMPGMSAMPAMPGMTVPNPAAPTRAETPMSQGPNAVAINDFAFAPVTLTVPVGATVTWTNHDEEPHTVVASDGSFHSPGMGAGGTYSFTFTNVGSYDYVCSIHPFMHGTVVVTK